MPHHNSNPQHGIEFDQDGNMIVPGNIVPEETVTAKKDAQHAPKKSAQEFTESSRAENAAQQIVQRHHHLTFWIIAIVAAAAFVICRLV